MNLRSLKSLTFIVLFAATLSLTIVVVWISLRSGATTAEMPLDVFPEDLPESLKEEIAVRQRRLQQNPSASSWGALGELCAAYKLMPQAESCFRKASSLAPEDPRWIYHLAVMAEKVNLEQAVELYDQVLSLDRSVAAVHYHRGRALARIGRLDDAETSLNTAAEISQRHPLVLKALAQLRMMKEDSKEARLLILEAVNDSRAGMDIVSEAKRLILQQSSSDPEAASALMPSETPRPPITPSLPEPWMEGVVSRTPGAKEVGLTAGVLASQQKFDAAREMYGRLMKMQSRNSRAHTAHAMVLMNAGNAKQALEEMKKVCEQFPQDALVFSSRGTIEAQLEDYPAAIRSFEEAVRLKPDFVDAHRALLLIFQFENMTERMDAQFKTLLSLVPGDKDLQQQYSKFLEDQGKAPEAR